MNTNMRLDASPLVIVGYATIGGFCGALAGMFVAPCCLGTVGIAAWGALGGGVGWSVGAAIGTISSWNGTRTSESSARSLVAWAVGFVLGGVAIAARVTTIDGRAAPLRPEIVLVIALDVALAVATCLTVAPNEPLATLPRLRTCAHDGLDPCDRDRGDCGSFRLELAFPPGRVPERCA